MSFSRSAEPDARQRPAAQKREQPLKIAAERLAGDAA